MRLVCYFCGKVVSNEVPEETALVCPECIEQGKIQKYLRRSLMKKERGRRSTVWITEEAIRLIEAEARRKHRSSGKVINDLIANSARAECLQRSNLFEAMKRLDLDDENWKGQLISNLAIRNLKVN